MTEAKRVLWVFSNGPVSHKYDGKLNNKNKPEGYVWFQGGRSWYLMVAMTVNISAIPNANRIIDLNRFLKKRSATNPETIVPEM